MSLNLYDLIMKTAKEMDKDINLKEMGAINNSINNLISRGINMDFIKNNLEILF